MSHGSNGRLLTLDRFLERAFDRFHDRTAICFGDQQFTYDELERKTAQLAAAYRSLGLAKDDRLGILMANRPEFVIAHIAAIRAGVTVVPLNAQLDDEDVRTLAASADIHTILVDEAFFEVVRAIQREAQAFDYVIGHGPREALPIGFHSLDEVLERAPAEPPTVDIDPDDVAALYYSSGTTGDPKGILHAHRQLTLNAFVHVQELDIRHKERVLLVTPLAHSAEPITRAALCQGATIFLQQGFDSTRVLETVADRDISWTYLVPTMIADLVDASGDDGYDTSTLETLAYGAAPIPEPTLERGLDLFGQVFVQFYGLTEVPNLISVLSKVEHDPSDESALRSAGHPAQLVEVAIREEATDWGEGIGEIVVRSPYAFVGYTNDRPATDDDGWIRTGDVGRFDETGRLHVLDRLQDVIIRDGEPVYSSTVESAIQQHPDVKQVGVIGVPENGQATTDAHPEQRVKAVVVPQDSTTVELEDLQPLCRDHTGRDIPDSIDVVGRLPETPYGKIDKQALRDPYW